MPMTKTEIRTLLATILTARTTKLDTASVEDWRLLEERFRTRFPEEFIAFVDLMSEFHFEGDIFHVRRRGNANWDDSIETVFDCEREISGWPEHLVPFFGLGNGDYFALSATEGVTSAVYFRDHEDNYAVRRESVSFEMWLRQLPAFLRGEST